MAFDKTPSVWLGGGYSYGTNQIILNTEGHATPLLTELTAAEANATTGDIRKIVFALMEMLYTKRIAVAEADLPTKMAIYRSVSEPYSGMQRKTYTIVCDSLVTGQEVLEELTLASLSVTSGAAAGGTATTLTGTGFMVGATVTVGGASATSVVVVNATTITIVTPAGTAGAVAVVVTNPDAKTATLATGFTYT